MASSYVDTAHRAMKLGDQTKSIACFAAAYGWMSDFLQDSPTPDQTMKVLLKIIESLMILTHIVKPFDPQAACCAGVEALVWSKRSLELTQYVTQTLKSTQLWSFCPSHYENMASNVIFSSPTDNGIHSMSCTRLGLLINSEDIIGSFSLNQKELFQKKSDRHDYHPYKADLEENQEKECQVSGNCEMNTDQVLNSRVPTTSPDKHCICPPNIILYDLEVKPISRFTPEQWSYIDESIVGKEEEGVQRRRSMVDWHQVGKDDYEHLLRAGLELEFNEMFHSCVVANDDIIPNKAVIDGDIELVCVWRRHMQLFHMVGFCYM